MLGGLRERCARIRAFFRNSDLDRDFEEELHSHVAMLTEDNVRGGMTREEARRAALIRVGGAASLRERHREARGLPAFDTLLHDLRFALRVLIKDRWFTAAVVVALALGMGVNTTVFTVINGWNLRDLPWTSPVASCIWAPVTRKDAPGACRTGFSRLAGWIAHVHRPGGVRRHERESRGGGPSCRSSGRLLPLRQRVQRPSRASDRGARLSAGG